MVDSELCEPSKAPLTPKKEVKADRKEKVEVKRKRGLVWRRKAFGEERKATAGKQVGMVHYNTHFPLPTMGLWES